MRFLSKSALLLLLLSFALLAPGCASAKTSLPPPPCPTSPPHGCRVVIPPCQPPAYVGMGMPQDTANQLGFLPYVATWLPDTVTWYSAAPYPETSSSAQALPSQPRPLMRLEYSYFFARPYNAYAPHTVIAFDETTQPLSIATNIVVPGQTLAVTSKETVQVDGHAATYFELQSSSATNATHVIGVQWQVGTVWVRVTAVTSGRYFTGYGEGDTLDGNGVDVSAWTGTSRDEVLHVANSARIYTGCDRTAASAH